MTNIYSYMIYRMVPFPMTLNDSNLDFKVTVFLTLIVSKMVQSYS